MSNDSSRIRDAFQVALARAREICDGQMMMGWGVVELRGPDGRLKQVEPFANVITNTGDEYYCKRGMAGVQPANAADMSPLATGMKLGANGSGTAASKSGAGAVLVGTYLTGSNNAFFTGYPQAVDETGDTGWSISYQTQWAAGDVTNANIDEAIITRDQSSDATSSAANTLSRVVFADINKQAADTLTITWKHTFNAAAS